jgi:hypothetical protein
MRKTILFFCLAFSLFGFKGFSQSLNNVPIRDIDIKYFEVIATFNQSNTMTSFELDLGQTNRAFTNKQITIRDQNGIVMKFYSMVDVLNFFSKNGFELDETYTISSGNIHYNHYVLKRKG